jgi:hypothetical protein
MVPRAGLRIQVRRWSNKWSRFRQSRSYQNIITLLKNSVPPEYRALTEEEKCQHMQRYRRAGIIASGGEIPAGGHLHDAFPNGQYTTTADRKPLHFLHAEMIGHPFGAAVY